MTYATRGREAAERRGTERRGTGWLVFASVVMITAGVMRIIDALWAFDRDNEVGGDIDVLVWDDNLAAYGWLWLAVGVLLIVAGFGVLQGSDAARWFGIVMASLAAVTSFLWIYAFPIWSLVSTLIALAVVYGLAAYGGREPT